MASLPLAVRLQIEALLKQGFRAKAVALKLGLHPSTIYREIRKCADFYNAYEAHKNTCHGMHPIDYDIIGKRFGLLVVKAYVNRVQKHRTFWLCQCDCGREIIFSRKVLMDYCSDRRPLSCGCIAKQYNGFHGKVPTEEAAMRKFQDMMKFRDLVDGHWEWTGYCQKNKKWGTLTPRTSWKNKAMSVRKCIWLLMRGEENAPREIFLTCDNPLCFNPDHLTDERPEKRVIFNKS